MWFNRRQKLTVFVVLLVVCFQVLQNENKKGQAEALSWSDISDAFEDAVDAGSGLIDDLGDALGSLVDSVANAFTSLGSAITGVAAAAAIWLYSVSTEAGYSLVCIYTITELATDVIDDVLDGFNVTTWDKMADGAKYVVYNLNDLVDDEANQLADYVVEYIAVGTNYLSDLSDLDIDDYLPFPFDVVDESDFYSAADCLDDLVLEAAIDFAENVVSTLVDLGDDTDITMIFNTEDIKDELNSTYECLLSLGTEISNRQSDDDDTIFASYIQEAYSYFEFDELVHGIDISFTACTLVCGSASIGFAVAPESKQFGAFYSVKSGVETSSVVGASIEASWSFFPNWDAVAVSSGHVISFDASISLPLVPISVGTNIGVAIDDSGDFGGFVLTNDILDVSLGFNGAFGLGYSYVSTYWITSLTDLGNAWNAFEDVGEIASDNVELAVAAYDLLTETLGSGGYLSDTSVSTFTFSGTTFITTQTISLACPSGELKNAGNASALVLGYIEINEVVYGNITGDNWCNDSRAYEYVYDECAWLANCTFQISSSNLGEPDCDDYSGSSYDLDIIYSCPTQGSVYDIGCFGADFWEIVDSGWIQDYSSYDFMDDNWEERENSIAKCSKIASDYGYDGFALYNHGMCLVGKDFLNDGNYNRYNITDCPTDPQDGRGGPDSINVYIFANDDLAFDDLGCFNTTFIEENYPKMEFTSVEKEHQLMQDDYSSRKLAVSKCAQVADENDKKGFALLDGGSCYIGDDFEKLDSAYEGNVSTFDCGTGKGSDISYNAYMFPYATLSTSSSSSGLSDAAIAGIVSSCIIFVLCVAGGVAFFLWKTNKCKIDFRMNTRHMSPRQPPNGKSNVQNTIAQLYDNPTGDGEDAMQPQTQGQTPAATQGETQSKPRPPRPPPPPGAAASSMQETR